MKTKFKVWHSPFGWELEINNGHGWLFVNRFKTEASAWDRAKILHRFPYWHVEL